jgi:hypothetical protein
MLIMFLQGSNAQAKHTTIKLVEEKIADRNSQESTKSGSPDICFEDGRYVGTSILLLI